MITIPSIIEKVTTLKDKSVKLTVETQELSEETMKQVFGYYGKPGWFIFHDRPEMEVDTEKLPEVTIEKDDKTPSQRLRAVIYITWKQSEKTKDISSEEFYRLQMEKLITFYKEKLN